LFISDTEEQKRHIAKTGFVYLLVSLFCVMFGAIYEHFSHEVYSGYMIYAFMFPLAGGTLPFAALSLQERIRLPGRLPLNLYNAGIAALTVGSIMEGALEIYGTTNDSVQVYWFVGFCLAGIGLMLYVIGLLRNRKNKSRKENIMKINSKLITMILVTVLTLSLAGCGTSMNNTSDTSPAVSAGTADETNTVTSIETEYTAEDTNANWDNASATQIELSGMNATISGSGATAEDGIVTITTSGVYVLSGNFTGSVVISAASSDSVQLVLNGLNITADQNAAIYCSNANKLIIVLADGTDNTVTDASNFTYADAAAEEPDAVIFSKVDLTINGNGSLTVNANYNNGIGTKDDLVVTGGTFIVHAANDGFRGRDSVSVLDGCFTIVSGSDGIQSNNDEDASKGWVLLEGGTYHIISGNDAVQAETLMEISGGTYELLAGGGNNVGATDTSESYKGIKAGTNITISGGSFIIDSADDSVHANGSITVNGGEFTMSSGDDAIHADGDLTVSGSATMDILTSYEGLEAKSMTLADGIININADDDGINISGGNDSGSGGMFGKDNFNAGGSDQWLKITGGTITVVAGADGIDINGSGEMTGGTVDITAATLGEGNTIDCDGTFNRTGGTLTEVGGNGMGGGKQGRR